MNEDRAKPADGWRFSILEFDLSLWHEATRTEAPAVLYLGKPAKLADREAMQADKGACWLPTLRCTWETLEAREGVAYELVTGEELDNRRAARFIQEPEQISEADYWEHLEVMPPQRWQTLGDFEAFHCLERYSGDVARWTVKHGRGEGATFWAFRDRTGATIQHLRAKVLAAIELKKGAA